MVRRYAIRNTQLPLGAGSPANLTKTIEASGQPEAQSTQFSYTGTAGGWGLPDTVTNAVGGMGLVLATSGSHMNVRT